MSCDITKGRLEPCLDVVGGVKAVYFVNYDDIGVEYDATDDHIIDDINDGTALQAATLFKWDVKGACSLDENVNSSRDTGTTFIEQVLNLTLKKKDTDTHKELMLIAYGRPVVFVHTYNGECYCCGVENGMDLTGGTIVTGNAMGDLNGYTMVLTGMERKPANFLDGATLADPFAGMTTAPTITVGT